MNSLNLVLLFTLGRKVGKALGVIWDVARDLAQVYAKNQHLTGAEKKLRVVDGLKEAADEHADDLGEVWSAMSEEDRDEFLNGLAVVSYRMWLWGTVGRAWWRDREERRARRSAR